ncbi:MAG: hypothetical protein ACRENG_28960, partial [bacterium]
NSEIHTIDLARKSVYIGGLFSKVGRETRRNVAALDSATGNVIAWNNAPTTIDSLVRSLVVRDSIIYMGGNFTSITSQTRNRLAALDARTGALITTWNPNVSGASPSSVHKLVLSGSTVYAGGRFTTVGGHPRNHIAAIDAVSGIPTPMWNPTIVGTTAAAGNIPVRAITVSGSTLYFGGEFTRVGSETRSNAAAVRADNGILTEWNPNVTGGFSTTGFTTFPAVSTLEAVESTVFIGGNFTSIAGMTHTFFAPLGETPLNPIPTLRSMNPKSGKRLQTLDVTFEGTNFSEEVSAVNVGSGIAVNSITVTNARRLTANITISATASTGPRNFFRDQSSTRRWLFQSHPFHDQQSSANGGKRQSEKRTAGANIEYCRDGIELYQRRHHGEFGAGYYGQLRDGHQCHSPHRQHHD